MFHSSLSPLACLIFFRMLIPSWNDLIYLFTCSWSVGIYWKESSVSKDLVCFVRPSTSLLNFYFIYKNLCKAMRKCLSLTCFEDFGLIYQYTRRYFKCLFHPLVSSKPGRNMVCEVFWFIITLESYRWVIENAGSL